MDEVQDRKRKIRLDIAKKLDAFSESELKKKTLRVERRLFDFANFIDDFLESTVDEFIIGI
mgnify:CR=1 FL=1